MNSQRSHPADMADSAEGPTRTAASTPAPGKSATTAEIQRQYTRYLRDPDNAPLPSGTDAMRMRLCAVHFRAKLCHLLRLRMPGLVGALGKDRTLALLNDYVRLPRMSLGGGSSFEDSFLRWLKDECAAPALPPWIPDFVEFTLAAMQVKSPPVDSGLALDSDGDLLAGVPVFSEPARLLCLGWPVHRVDGDFNPNTGANPKEPTWLIVYRNRRGEGGYLELNRMAADVVARVRDNFTGRTGAEILADANAGFSFNDPGAVLRDGFGILEALRQRDIILGTRAPR